ncbi:hypothetical protein Clacol_002495 [Clathrus columnatus]|uniref:SMODS and SLOG-associating 2TM effector domain-containing protein n=1 Tax=Clathrus columnatus TaxID=1419009 RepID=A0AAV5A5N9_9AGAM|nr:hypothetical protein Clacol_002495 [Clathrus columnatus]
MEGYGSQDGALHSSPSRITALPLPQDGVPSPGVSPRASRRYTQNNLSPTMAQEDVPVDDPPIPELPFPATTAVRDAVRTRSTGSVPRIRKTGLSASIEDEERAVEWIAPLYKVPTDAQGNQSRGPKLEVNGKSAVNTNHSEDEINYPIGTVGRRLQHTLKTAKEEQSKYEKQASLAAWATNIAMFSQIVSNAIITGLSASGGGRHGALGTIVSAFLARIRGTREPERSKTHSQNLEKYIRELRAFIEDHGMSQGREHDDRIGYFRDGFNKLQTAIHQAENGQPLSSADSGPPSPHTTTASTIAPSEKSVIKPE